jgi:hypothetical protein
MADLHCSHIHDAHSVSLANVQINTEYEKSIKTEYRLDDMLKLLSFKSQPYGILPNTQRINDHPVISRSTLGGLRSSALLLKFHSIWAALSFTVQRVLVSRSSAIRRELQNASNASREHNKSVIF